jgi:ribosomal protein S12 methylthiotransferase accessory factor
MILHPRLKSTVYIHHVDGHERIVLLSETQTRVVDAFLYRPLLPLLDGSHTIQDIANNLRERLKPKDILGCIHSLSVWGFLADGVPQPTNAQDPYWEAQGLNDHSQTGSVVTVQGYGSVSKEPFLSALAGLGVDTHGDPSLELVLTDDYLREELSDYNKRATVPWMLVKPVGLKVWLGPIFLPGETACWECMAQRLRLNKGVERYISRQIGRQPIIEPVSTPTTEGMAAHLAATHSAHWLSSPKSHTLTDNLVIWDYTSMQTESHRVVKRPQCPVCGNPIPPERVPMHLAKRKRVKNIDGGYRSATAEATYQRYNHHISPITGLVNHLEVAENADGVHVYRAGSNLITPAETWSQVTSAAHLRIGGKGRTALQAKVSGLCEALERYSSQFFIGDPVEIASYNELKDNAVHPNSLIHFSEAQYEDRMAYNQADKLNKIPPPFEDDVSIPWAKVWSMTHKTWRYLPAGFCYLNTPQIEPRGYIVGDTNGNAAGSSIEDAFLQGFLELVERDCVALWWYNRLPKTGVSLEGIDDRYIETLTRYYAAKGRKFWLLDITSDTGIPAIVALSRPLDDQSGGLVYGFGAHLNPKIAAIRALTELNQLLPRIVRQAGEEAPLSAKVLSHSWEQGTFGSSEDEYQTPAADVPLKRISDFDQPDFVDINAAIAYCMDRIHDLGLEVLVHNLTRPDVGLPVVKVIVPGLRFHWRRLGPGRLYDVPVKMGWLPAPLSEEQLNPVDISS